MVYIHSQLMQAAERGKQAPAQWLCCMQNSYVLYFYQEFWQRQERALSPLHDSQVDFTIDSFFFLSFFFPKNEYLCGNENISNKK